MDVWAPSPSPIALFLLGLDERGAEGTVEVGERTVVLRRGRVVDVRRAQGDPALHDFLHESGRITDAELATLKAASRDPDRLPEGSRLLSQDALAETLRALWLDRLVRGMGRSESEGRSVPPLRPEGVPAGASIETALVPLVLDALERRAADGDAEQVGARAAHRLDWLEGPHVPRARRWAGIEAKAELRVGALLTSAPAAASRIAALVRAGLARIVPPGASVPAPARRLPTLPAPAPVEPAGRPSMMSLAPPRPAAVQLSPGAAQAFANSGELAVTLPEPPPVTGSLEDPLDPIEREIAALEESDAPPEERAAAWRAAAETWLERYGSAFERERALREAAAALASDPDVLLAAADACAACARNELALAYGRAAVAAADEGTRRDDVLIAYAMLCRRIGRAPAALSALRAASQGSRGGEARMIAASVLLSQGRPADAADEMLEAAALLVADDPERADFLTRTAWWLAPNDDRATDAFSVSLAREDRRPAAIAVRSDAARRAATPDARRRLRLAAAERAELDERPLLAADLLLRALDEEPELEVLYDPLDGDLEAAGALIERAVVLEELSAACASESRAHWLTRAADARLEIAGDGAWELELRLRCLELEPEDERAMIAVRRQAEAAADPMVLADALERVARAQTWSSDIPRRAMLEELGAVAEELTHEPLRAAWARSVAAAMGGEPMPRARARFEQSTRPAMQHAAALERLSREGDPDERRMATVDLASILAQDPERRERAIALLTGLLEQAWDDRGGDLLERILALRGDVAGRIAVLERRVEHEPRRIERVRRLLRVASFEAARGEHRAAARACLRALEEVPSHREAIIRARRAASRMGDDALVRDALAREARLELAPAERARALTALAARAEASGDHDAARDNAATALEADPQAAEAALILARRLATGTAPALAIDRALALLGDVPPLVAGAIRASTDDGARLTAIERWSRLAPTQVEPWLEALAIATERGATDLATRAIESLTRDPRADAASVRPLVDGIRALAESASLERATALAITTADRFGEAGAPLRDLASSLAERTGASSFTTAALERSLPAATDADAITTLRAIAAQHQREDDLAAEARALLRLLARAPRDHQAIDRLATIYASTGEHERLMAALALRIAEGAGEDERFEGWLALATSSAQILGDVEGAESFARSALTSAPPITSDDALARAVRVSGVLVAIDRAHAAVALLRDESQRADAAYAGKLAERAAAIAARSLGDLPLALEVATLGLLATPGYAPLLVAFEQLALQVGDVEGAERTYGELVTRAMGSSGRRALLYRRARWLERAGAESVALQAYLDAAEHSASSGVILTAVERLARATGDLDALARGLQVLANNAPHPAIRLGMLQRAASLLEQEIGRPERAWEILFPVWKQTGLAELEEDLGRLGAAMAEISSELGDQAFDGLFAELERRAGDAWMTDEKARLTMKSARLHALARGDLARAEALAGTALAVLRGDEDTEPTKIAAVLAELATWIARDAARLADAKALAAEALDADSDTDAARTIAATLGLAVPERRPPQPDEDWGAPSASASLSSTPAAPASATLTAPPSAPPRSASAAGASDATHELEAPRASRAPVVVVPETDDDTAYGGSDRPSRMDLWVPAPANGMRTGAAPIAMPVTDDDAASAERPDELEARARDLAARDAGLPDAAALLRAALAIEPSRMSALQLLADVATRAGLRAETAIARAVLSVTEPARRAPGALSIDGRAIAAQRDAVLREPSQERARALLRAVWESALPMFRMTAPQLGIVGTDRVGAHSPSQLGRALAAVLEVLPEDDASVFAVRRPHTGIIPVRTQPPSVLVGSDAPLHHEGSLRFLLGRALELARPEHALVATFGEDEGRTFFAALRAAFGPAEGAHVEREAAALASELWRTIPARSQRDVRELLLESEPVFDWDQMRAAIFGGAARAGLVASGDVAASMRALMDEEAAPTEEHRLDSLDELAEAITRSTSLADLVRFAFSDAFVDAVR